MADYELSISPKALRDLESFETALRQRLGAAIEELATDPRPHGCVKLKSSFGEYRIRVGDYRIKYLVDDAARNIRVLAVKHRRDVYRA